MEPALLPQRHHRAGQDWQPYSQHRPVRLLPCDHQLAERAYGSYAGTRHLLELPQWRVGDRQAGNPYPDHCRLRRLPSHNRLAAGDLQPRQCDRQLFLLPQRHDRHRQAADASGHDQHVRRMPPLHQQLDELQCQSREVQGRCDSCHNGTSPKASRGEHPDHITGLRRLPQHPNLGSLICQSAREKNHAQGKQFLFRHGAVIAGSAIAGTAMTIPTPALAQTVADRALSDVKVQHVGNVRR